VKLQNPNIKLQRNFKIQGSNCMLRDGGNLDWEEEDKSRLREDEAELHPFDLEERTARFGEAMIRLLKKVPRDPGNNRLIDQLTGCATSVGANYCEASEKTSKRDFRHSISRCAKEAKETKFFLRMLAAAEPSLAENAREMWREVKQLHLIFCSMLRK
jgi:four helix bundle protein